MHTTSTAQGSQRRTARLTPDAAQEAKFSAGRERCIRSLADFIRATWHVLEPGTKLRWNWHLDIMCRELEAVLAGDVRELVFCVPPGKMKSLVVSVFFPAWEWLHRPEERYLCVANDPALAVRDSKRMRDLVSSREYRALLKHQIAEGRIEEVVDEKTKQKRPWQMSVDQNAKVNFENDFHGFRQCVSIGGSITGKRGSRIIVDDPVDAKAVVLGSASQNARRMADIWATYNSVIESRLNDEATGTKIVVMQRLHPDDLAGMLISGGVRAVVIASEYDPEDPLNHPDDPRTQPGQLIEDRDAESIEKRRQRMPKRHFQAQYNQRPSRAEGSMYRLGWFQHHELDCQRAEMDERIITVDANFKGGADSDYVAIQVWGKKGHNFYLLDQTWDQYTYVDTRAALRIMLQRHPLVDKVVIEAAANGWALLSDLAASVPGLVAFSPKASKEARAEIAAVQWQEKRVFVPAHAQAEWVLDFQEEVLAFPSVDHDDRVDAMSMAILFWTDETDAEVEATAGLEWLT